MRILIIPLISMGETETDSNFRVYEDLIENCPQGYFFYMVVSEYMKQESIDTFHTKHPNCMLIKTEWIRDFWTESLFVPETVRKLFAQRGGKYPIDLIVTSKTPAVCLMKSMLGDFRRTSMLPIHIFEPLVRVDQSTLKTFRTLIINGYVNANTWFLNTREKEIAVKAMRGYLSPSQFNQTKDSMYIDGLGINVDAIDKAIVGCKKSE